MNIFLWLLVGHLLGDWLLQNDWMATRKKEGLFTLGGIIHVAIYTVTIVGVLHLVSPAQANSFSYLMAGIVIFLSHWLIDSTDVVGYWMRFFRQSNLPMVRVMVDQTFHVLVLVPIALVFVGNS